MDYNEEGCKYLIVNNYYDDKEVELCQLYNNVDLFNYKRKHNIHPSLLEVSDSKCSDIIIVLTTEGDYKVLKELEIQNEYGEFYNCVLTCSYLVSVSSDSTLAFATLRDGKTGIFDFSEQKFITPLFDNVRYFSRISEEIDKGVYETTTIVEDIESNTETELIGYIYSDGSFASPVLDLYSEKYYDMTNYYYDGVIEDAKKNLINEYKKKKNNVKRLIKIIN